MTLVELSKRLFSYLVHFRDKAQSAAPPRLEEVREDILGIFHNMEEQASRTGALAAGYKQVKYALTVFTDEVILNSGWEHAPEWEKGLLEERFFKSNVAGDRFYVLAGKLEGAPRDVIAVYFYCLAMGFKGHFSQDDERLLALKADLLAKLQRGKPASAGISPSQSLGLEPVRPATLGRLWSWRYALAALGAIILVVFLADRLVVWPWLLTPVSEVAVIAKGRLSQDAETPQAAQADQPAGQAGESAQKASAQAGPAGREAGRYQAEKTGAKPGLADAPKAAGRGQAGRAAKKEGFFKRAEEKVIDAARAVERDLGILPQKPKARPRPAPAAAKPATPAPEPKPEGFMVQAGTYNGPISASRFAGELQDAGYQARVMKAPRGHDRSWYVVAAGPYKNFSDALRVEKQMRDKFKTSPFVVDAKEWGQWSRLPGGGE